MDLFDRARNENRAQNAPLAERLRPKVWGEFVGQSHLIGPGKFLTEALARRPFPSLIFWGPPGTGKTTLAQLIAKSIDARFVSLSAVTSGIKEVKAVIAEAEEALGTGGKATLLFVDEIHRFNKAQQDAFLPHVESGTISLIGATTENPSFEVISALLSRARVLILNPLSSDELKTLVKRALAHFHPTKSDAAIAEDAIDRLLLLSDGDARRALNALEQALGMAGVESISIVHIETSFQAKALLYDKSGEEHYNLISAFIKSMRGSDPDAAVYYLARMLEAGEDPLFLARRMVIFASEDVGNADPQAIQVAISVKDAVHFIGMPEGWIPLAQGATYLASAEKSNASYMAYKRAKAEIGKTGALPTPLHIRNAPTRLLKELDYGKDYAYPHDYEGNIVRQDYLPEKLRGQRYYEPTQNGEEAKIRQRLEAIRTRFLRKA